MHKKLLLALLVLMGQAPLQIPIYADCCTSSCDSFCACKTTSHTFFSIRPVFTVVSPEYLAHNHNTASSLDACGSSLQCTVLGGRSTNNDAIARFFLPFCRTTLNVTETQTATTDVLANYLNIYTAGGNFASTVTFKPHHSYVGVGINYQNRFYAPCPDQGFWLTVSGPLLQVRNRIELVEEITTAGGAPLASPALTAPSGGCPANCPNSCNTDCILDPAQALPPVGSVAAAFAQPGWCFGRIDNADTKHQRKTRLGDITARIGYELVNRTDCHLDPFVGFIIPTGNKPQAINVFEPMVGHNHHWGILIGSSFGLEIWRNDCTDTIIRAEFDWCITDLFARNERRSFDLKNKPWSRYMQFYRTLAQATLAATPPPADFTFILHTPGIDLLTQEVRVNPGYYRTFNVALIANRNCFDFEAGYNFFARQAECIRFTSDCPFPADAALKAVNIGDGATGRFQLINNFFGQCIATPVAGYATNIITASDIDLDSAAHPAVLTHTIYGSVAYKIDICQCYPGFIGVGASYEFGTDNAALHRWMAWGKFGITF